jgi:hypothetical protein
MCVRTVSGHQDAVRDVGIAFFLFFTTKKKEHQHRFSGIKMLFAMLVLLFFFFYRKKKAIPTPVFGHQDAVRDVGVAFSPSLFVLHPRASRCCWRC